MMTVLDLAARLNLHRVSGKRQWRGACPACGYADAFVLAERGGRPVAIHRTYLRPDGSGKAAIEATLGPVWGGAIRLDPVAPDLIIGEGIETSASAGRLIGLPAWAAVSAGNLAVGLVLLAEVQSVVIAADAGEAGEHAARVAASRWQADDRRVRIARPDQAESDFNDILRARAAAEVA